MLCEQEQDQRLMIIRANSVGQLKDILGTLSAILRLQDEAEDERRRTKDEEQFLIRPLSFVLRPMSPPVARVRVRPGAARPGRPRL